MTLIRSVNVVGNDSSLNQVSARSHVPLILSNGLWRHMYHLCGDVYIYLCGDIHTVVGITYVQTYIPLQRPIYQCGDIHTFVESYLPMWRHTYLCRGLSTYVETYIPLQRPIYLCGDIYTFVGTCLLMWRHTFLCRELPTFMKTTTWGCYQIFNFRDHLVYSVWILWKLTSFLMLRLIAFLVALN